MAVLTKEEKQEYLNRHGIGSYCLCNFGGIEIKDIINGINDYVVFTYFDIPKVYVRKIDCTASGRDYFRFGSMRIYLDECMRF